MIGRHRGFEECQRCGDTDDWKWRHFTPRIPCAGCSPLCEECWASLTPEQRLPFYERHIAKCVVAGIEPDVQEKAESLRQAVLAGK